MALFDFERKAGPFNDATSAYKVIFRRPVSVAEFIDDVLTRNEWGAIRIFDSIGTELKECEYSKDNLLSAYPEEYKDQTIVVANAAGGWSCMDYHLILNIDETTKTCPRCGKSHTDARKTRNLSKYLKQGPLCSDCVTDILLYANKKETK